MAGVAAQDPRRAVVHVGLMKSGTTYLQSVLNRNRDRLREHGVLFPGAVYRDQIAAAREIRGSRRRSARGSQVTGSWAHLAAQMCGWDGDSVFSQETVAAAGPRQIEWMLAELEPLQVHVVLTARDLARTLPSIWQERLRNDQAQTWPEFTELARGDGPPSERFWRMHDIADVVERWSAAVPAERIHVVTVPGAGQSGRPLLERFCQVVGVPAASLDDGGGVPRSSLGAVQAELLRRVDHGLGGNLPWPQYEVAVKRRLGNNVLARQPGPSLALPRAELDWVRDRAARSIERLRSSGCTVVGDLSDLEPRDESTAELSGARAPGEVSDRELADAAVDALVELVRDARPGQPAKRAGKAGAAKPGAGRQGPGKRGASRLGGGKRGAGRPDGDRPRGGNPPGDADPDSSPPPAAHPHG